MPPPPITVALTVSLTNLLAILFIAYTNTRLAMPPPPTSSIQIAEPPKVANHSIENMVGISTTPIANSRIVRPRLIRAMKMPTNGPQATHQIR